MGPLDCDGGGHHSADRPTGNYPFVDTGAFIGTNLRAALLPVSPSSSNDLSSAGNPDPLQCCVKQHLNAVAREVRVYLRECFTAQKPTKGI
jgi:hypothetical protein